MGNRVQKQETWEANEQGGDYRIKYRSWRLGVPESGPFNAPSTNNHAVVGTPVTPRTRAGSSTGPMNNNRPAPRTEPRVPFDVQLEAWARSRSSSSTSSITSPTNNNSISKRKSSIQETTGIFPPEAVNNEVKEEKRPPTVNELMLDELAKTVTVELVGPEFTPVAKMPSTSTQDASVERERNLNLISPKSGSAFSEEESKESETVPDEPSSNSVKMVVNHLYAPVLLRVKEHLRGLPEWYSSKTPPIEVARHIRILLEARRCGPNEVVVSVSPQLDSSNWQIPGLYIVVVCAKDRRQLLDAITRCVSARASISEATIVTTSDGYALDKFVLSARPEDADSDLFDDLERLGSVLKQDIEEVLASTPASPTLTPTALQQTPSTSGRRRSRLQSLSNPGRLRLDSQMSTVRFEVPFQEIRLVRVLGEGRTGKTYMADWNGERVAAKVMNIDDSSLESSSVSKKLKSNLDELRRELHLVSKLDHPNIVKFIGASARPPRYIILFELCECDLAALVRQKDRKYSFFQFALDIAYGLEFLHRNDIIHRDVKPENLMLDKTGKRVKVADFGLSCYVSGAAAEFTAETGTYRYMAPEVMRHEHYSFPADVYSFALVCYFLLTRRPPFDDCTPLQAALGVARQDLRPKLPSNLPKELTELITSSWSRDPSRRPTFDSIIVELEEMRKQLNNRARKMLDWGFHEINKKRSSLKSPFSSTRSILSLTSSVV